MEYEIKDIELAEEGRKKIEWAEMRMPILKEIKKRFEKSNVFYGLKIGMLLHLTKETAVLVKTLKSGGAKIRIASCNPLSTQDDVAAALVEEGIEVFAKKGESVEEYHRYLDKVVEFEPDIVIDDGADLIVKIHEKKPELLKKMLGATEETTTGIIRLKAMEKERALKIPVIGVNENKTKRLVDNYYGTGQSTIDGILRSTNILFAGKTVVVAGYGPCGKGVALRAKGMGSKVIVTEVDAFRALQAALDGFEVMPMRKACEKGDIFITVTGNKNVITAEHIKKMKDGAVLANSGHFDVEIDVKGLEKIAERKRRVRGQLDEYIVNGKRIFLCAEGRLVNLGAAEGHPSEVMATSFAGQALACEFLVKNKNKPGLIMLPEKIDNEIAELQLKSMGIEKDELTEEQKKYLESWEEGT